MDNREKSWLNTDCTPEQRMQRADCKHCSLRDRMLFADVDVDAASTLLKQVNHIRYLPGEPLYHQGEEPSAVYSVRRGIVKLSLVSPNGDLRIVRLIGPGAAIGLETLLEQPYQHTAVPLTKTAICRLPISTVKQLSTEQPLLYQRLMRQWQDQLSHADAILLKLSAGSIRERVLNLLQLMVSLCEKGETEFLLPSNPDCAALVAARVESVSREIAEFKRSGILVKSADGGWVLGSGEH